MGVRQWCEELLALPEEVWIRYAWMREPLRRRLTLPEYEPFYRQAALCGEDVARSIRQWYGPLSVFRLSEVLGVRVEYPKMKEPAGLVTFACYIEPDTVQIFTDNARDTEALIEAAGMTDILGGVSILEMLLAHELFHVLQVRNTTLYVNQKHLTLWKIGAWEHKSRLISLEDTAAAAFTRELLGIPFDPRVFDTLMLLPHAVEEAGKVYSELMRSAEELANG